MNKHVKASIAFCSIGSLGLMLFGASLEGWTGLGVASGLAIVISVIVSGIVYGNT